uniref:Protein kinase domain-containing protein n=1 Tax=Nothobranchius furzeri TaxID=105023 RepID=A0A8C6KTQ7_NOTFU
MLRFDPKERISAIDALMHEFFPRMQDDSSEAEGFTLDVDAVIKHKSDVYRCDNVLSCGSFGKVGKFIQLATKQVFAIKVFTEENHFEQEVETLSFGVVSKFKKLGTKLKVAVKIITEESYFEKELEALQLLRDLDQKVPNIIKYIAGFPYDGSFFVISELLDLNLLNFMKRRDYSPLRVSEIRPIAQQLFAALRALKSFGVTHLDIKPSNIMLVNHDSQPYCVKLIDFATASLLSFDIVQSKQYRAPEVFFGFPYFEGLDMWGVGCVLAFLSLGRDLFPPDSQYEVVRFSTIYTIVS